MVVGDENSGAIGEKSLVEQLQEGNPELGEYPSYDQNREDTGKTMFFSEVEAPQEAGQDQGSDNFQQSEPIQTVSEPVEENMNKVVEEGALQQETQIPGPMKITEEALEAENNKLQDELVKNEGEDVLGPIENSEDNGGENSEADLDAKLKEDESYGEDINVLDDSDEPFTGVRKSPYKVTKYNTGFILSCLGIIIFGGLSYLAYLFYQYLDIKSQAITENIVEIKERQTQQVQQVSNYYNTYGEKIGMFNMHTYENADLATDPKAADNILMDASFNYVQKKDQLQQLLTKFAGEILGIKEKTKELREDLNKNGFFPQELVNILKDDNAVSSIQRSLNSLEAVKFSSAIRVFSLMDDVVKNMADTFGLTKSDIKNRLEGLMERGEKDVEFYLNVCYNNPYEPESCDKIKDFDKYYKEYSENKDDKTFDTEFFKNLMKFINNQLEYSNLPSFSITFNSFDGKSNSISFSVEVNTTIEDETALIEQGIKSPHIFIISELIKLLKQSTFIVGKAIDAKDIRVVSKQITIAGKKFTVNNSVNTFVLPIQKTADREIFDFVEKYTSLVERSSDTDDLISSLLNEGTDEDEGGQEMTDETNEENEVGVEDTEQTEDAITEEVEEETAVDEGNATDNND